MCPYHKKRILDLLPDIFYDNKSQKIVQYEKDIEYDYPYTSYIKFYPRGKFGLFIIKKADTIYLKREDFNPKKAKMGYYIEKENKKIETKLETIGDCSLYISKKIGYIKEDSLFRIDRNGRGDIFIKTKVPSNLFNKWKPDW